ncbi:transposase [Ruminococcus sp.]|jgi:REP element-mobilizing transposase RayT|uniref:transposase n=1 Tax=Ruminococcus sp. TaxID=41978 RepID=UPI0025F7A842|nr:transposase [Ruminococcus sp.]
MDIPQRKDIRLHNYDYSRNGAYFVTICTRNKMCIFWDNNDKYKPIPPENGNLGVGTAIGRPQDDKKIHLSKYGRYVKEALNLVNKKHSMVFVDKYVIMPNHIHVIFRVDKPLDFELSGRPMAVPTISTVINQFKGYVSKKSGFHVWQGRFYDRVLRNDWEYRNAWQYIENNPENWENDELFCME